MKEAMRKRSLGFTLVELLVVIGIIALLISILLPALGKARDAANTVKCAANMHAIGAGFANYIANYKGFLPPSNMYRTDESGNVLTTPSNGFIHWSSFIYNDSYASAPPYKPFQSLAGWAMFQCPTLNNGGLAPANTFAGNNDAGLANDAGPNVVDFQAPRLAYTVNESLCPRGYMTYLQPGAPAAVNYPYHFVQAAHVRNSSGVVLATELSGNPDVATSTGLVSGNPSSNSRRPVNGVLAAGFTASYPMSANNSHQWVWAKVTNLHSNPQVQLTVGTSVNTTLDYIGRNHGAYKLGSVPGDTRGDWDLRKTNFLYLDGHVETKHISETVQGNAQWGDQFYTLDN
jgi:prepilin-type N-terminal cleavage/methylation domain-containing protein/prepilin-type processing-associated H-X9-DG protein